MTKEKTREENLRRALGSAKRAREWLVASEARPEEVDEAEIDAFEWAMDREAAFGLTVVQSALVLAGLVFSILVAMITVMLSQPRGEEVNPWINFVLWFYGILGIVPIVLIFVGNNIHSSAAGVRRGVAIMRVRRARRIRNLSMSRRGRKYLRSLGLL